MSRGAHGSAASWVCRRWANLYTRNLPAAERQRRRDEIESDLFEHAHDAAMRESVPHDLMLKSWLGCLWECPPTSPGDGQPDSRTSGSH